MFLTRSTMKLASWIEMTCGWPSCGTLMSAMGGILGLWRRPGVNGLLQRHQSLLLLLADGQNEAEHRVDALAFELAARGEGHHLRDHLSEVLNNDAQVRVLPVLDPVARVVGGAVAVILAAVVGDHPAL